MTRELGIGQGPDDVVEIRRVVDSLDPNWIGGCRVGERREPGHQKKEQDDERGVQADPVASRATQTATGES